MRGSKISVFSKALLPSCDQPTNVNVVIRIRPFLKDVGASSNFLVSGNERDLVDASKGVTYTLDSIFSETKTTKDVFDQAAKPIVNSCVEGFNGTIFAYGQTASGKTYTMQGGSSPQDEGITALSVRHVFQKIKLMPTREFRVSLTYVEVYNEKLVDLIAASKELRDTVANFHESAATAGQDNGQLVLNQKSGNKLLQQNSKVKGALNLKIVEGANGVVELRGATIVEVHSAEEVVCLLAKCENSRHVAGTELNERSSRSHSILSLRIESKDFYISETADSANVEIGAGKKEVRVPLRVGLLNLVDLAGSEGVSRSQTEGLKRFEGSKINQSLLALTRVISQIVQRQQKMEKDDAVPSHITYRDSKLTRLLSNSLGGNSKTLIICCCSPEPSDYRESVSTLEFASRAKCIRNKAKLNLFVTPEALRYQVEAENVRLREELIRLRLDLLKAEKERQARPSTRDSKNDSSHELPGAVRAKRAPSSCLLSKSRKRRGTSVLSTSFSVADSPECSTSKDIGDAQILLSHKLREESLDISEKKTVSLSPREQLKNHVTDPAHPDSAWTCSFLMTHFSKPPLTKKRQKVFCSTGIDTNSAAVSRTSMSSTTSLDVCETDSDCPDFVAPTALVSPLGEQKPTDSPVPCFKLSLDVLSVTQRVCHYELFPKTAITKARLPPQCSRSSVTAIYTSIPAEKPSQDNKAIQTVMGTADTVSLDESRSFSERLQQERKDAYSLQYEVLSCRLQEVETELTAKTKALEEITTQLLDRERQLCEYSIRVKSLEQDAHVVQENIKAQLSQEAELEKRLAVEKAIQKTKADCDAKLEQFQSDSFAKQAEQIEQLRLEAKADCAKALEDLRAKIIQETMESFERDFRLKAVSQRKELENGFRSEVENVKRTLHEQYVADLAAAREEAEKECETKITSLRTEWKVTNDAVLQQADVRVKELEVALQDLRQDAAVKLQTVEQEHEAFIETLQKAHTLAIETLKKEHSQALEKYQKGYEDLLAENCQVLRKKLEQDSYTANERVYNLETELELAHEKLRKVVEERDTELQASHDEIQRLKRLVDENAFISEEREFLESSLATVNNKLTALQQDYTLRLNEEQCRSAELKARLAENERESGTALQQTTTRLQEQLQQAIEAQHQIRSTFENVLEDANSQLQTVQNQYNSLKNDLGEKQVTLSSLMLDISCRDSRIKELLTENEALRDTVQNQGTALDNLRQEVVIAEQTQQREVIALEDCLKRQMLKFQKLEARYLAATLPNSETDGVQNGLLDSALDDVIQLSSVVTALLNDNVAHTNALCDMLCTATDNAFDALYVGMEDVVNEDISYLQQLDVDCQYADAAQDDFANLTDGLLGCSFNYPDILLLSLDLNNLTALHWSQRHEKWTSQEKAFHVQLREQASALDALHLQYEDELYQERQKAFKREQQLNDLVVAATAGQSTDQKTYKDAGVDASSITTIVNEAASHVSFKEQLALQAKLNELQQQYEQLLQSGEQEKSFLKEQLRSTTAVTETYKKDAQTAIIQAEALQLNMDQLREQIAAFHAEKLMLEDKLRKCETDGIQWREEAKQARAELDCRTVASDKDTTIRRAPGRYVVRSVLKTKIGSSALPSVDKP